MLSKVRIHHPHRGAPANSTEARPRAKKAHLLGQSTPHNPHTRTRRTDPVDARAPPLFSPTHLGPGLQATFRSKPPALIYNTQLNNIQGAWC